MNCLWRRLASRSWGPHTYNHKELNYGNNLNELGKGHQVSDENAAQPTPGLQPLRCRTEDLIKRCLDSWPTKLCMINEYCFKPVEMQYQHRKLIQLFPVNWLTLRVHNFSVERSLLAWDMPTPHPSGCMSNETEPVECCPSFQIFYGYVSWVLHLSHRDQKVTSCLLILPLRSPLSSLNSSDLKVLSYSSWEEWSLRFFEQVVEWGWVRHTQCLGVPTSGTRALPLVGTQTSPCPSSSSLNFVPCQTHTHTHTCAHKNTHTTFLFPPATRTLLLQSLRWESSKNRLKWGFLFQIWLFKVKWLSKCLDAKALFCQDLALGCSVFWGFPGKAWDRDCCWSPSSHRVEASLSETLSPSKSQSTWGCILICLLLTTWI